MAKDWNKSEIKEAQEDLKKLFETNNNYTVYCILRHRARSGMYRVISLKYALKDGSRIRDISYLACKAIDFSYDMDKEGIKVSGCGMDMGFHIVYTLSAVLYGYENKGAYKLTSEWM